MPTDLEKVNMITDEKKQKRNNLIVACLLGAIALIGIVMPALYITGMSLPK